MHHNEDKRYFTTIEILFISSMIGLDFAYGMVAGPILGATGILEIIRVDMIIPIMMMLITRLVVDKFGTLIVYEFVWGVLSILLRPTAFGAMPAFVKLVPAVMYGVILDSCMELFRNRPYARMLIAGVVGGVVNQAAFMGIRMLFGLPWSAVVQVLFGVNILTTVGVNLLAVHLTLVIWRSIEQSGWVRRIQAWRTT